jgi:hypothetical protein
VYTPENLGGCGILAQARSRAGTKFLIDLARDFAAMSIVSVAVTIVAAVMTTVFKVATIVIEPMSIDISVVTIV